MEPTMTCGTCGEPRQGMLCFACLVAEQEAAAEADPGTYAYQSWPRATPVRPS